MGYLLSYHTDTGRVKNVNQDALLLQSGCFKGEQIVLAVLSNMGKLPCAYYATGWEDWKRVRRPALP